MHETTKYVQGNNELPSFTIPNIKTACSFYQLNHEICSLESLDNLTGSKIIKMILTEVKKVLTKKKKDWTFILHW